MRICIGKKEIFQTLLIGTRALEKEWEEISLTLLSR